MNDIRQTTSRHVLQHRGLCQSLFESLVESCYSSSWEAIPDDNSKLLTVAEVLDYFESIYQSLLVAEDDDPENEGDIKIGTKYGRILAVDIEILYLFILSVYVYLLLHNFPFNIFS